MRFIHRDNFRHLTGLGREYVGFLEYICSDWKIEQGKPAPTGNLIVKKENGEFVGRFIPHDPALSNEEELGEYKASKQLTLSLIAEYNGWHEIVALPFSMVLIGAPDYTNLYQIYQHEFLTDQSGEPLAGMKYTGITKRGWRTRWGEHLRSAETGSNYRFHRAIRQWHGTAQIAMHLIVACGLSERAAMSIEETLVERETLYPLGLNMVPGGNAGLAYLRKIGAIGNYERVGPNDRQSVINRFFERSSRKGLPNPLAAANWLDPTYAEKVICAGLDRLKPSQIRDARFLSSLGKDVIEVAAHIGARNINQVRRLLAGETYSRIL